MLLTRDAVTNFVSTRCLGTRTWRNVTLIWTCVVTPWTRGAVAILWSRRGVAMLYCGQDVVLLCCTVVKTWCCYVVLWSRRGVAMLYCGRDVVLLCCAHDVMSICCRREVPPLCYGGVVFLKARMLFLRWGHDIDYGHEVLALCYWHGRYCYVWSRSTIVVLLMRGRHKVLSLPILHVWAWRAVTALYVVTKWYHYDIAWDGCGHNEYQVMWSW